MEMGQIDFMSFEEYKNKFFGNSPNTTANGQNMSNEEIEKEMMNVIKIYEQKKAGVKENGNI